jgi:hypothetical protein
MFYGWEDITTPNPSQCATTVRTRDEVRELSIGHTT